MHFSARTSVVCLLAFAALATQGGPAFAAATMPDPVSQAGNPSGNRERITLAREAIKSKDFKTSIAELTLAVQEHPGNAELHNLLGYSYRKQTTPDLPRAFEQYRLALKFDSEHRGANRNIGEAYLMEKNPAKAEEHLAKLKSICGNTTCEEYQDLAKSMAEYKAKNR